MSQISHEFTRVNFYMWSWNVQSYTCESHVIYWYSTCEIFHMFQNTCMNLIPINFIFNKATSYRRRTSFAYHRSQEERKLKEKFLFWLSAAKKCVQMREHYHKTVQRRYKNETEDPFLYLQLQFITPKNYT